MSGGDHDVLAEETSNIRPAPDQALQDIADYVCDLEIDSANA